MMGHRKRTYKVVEDGTNGPPHTKPALRYDGELLPPSQKIIFNKVDGMRKVDHHRIRFDIKDFGDSSCKLRFVANKDDVLWVKEGAASSQCPTSPCHDLPNTFWVDEMDEDGEWIDVINMNMKEEDFWFTLNFVDKNIVDPTEADYVHLDPPGGNQNGGGSGSGWTYKSLGVGILTGAVVGLGAVLATSNALDTPTTVLYGLAGAMVGLIVGFALERF